MFSINKKVIEYRTNWKDHLNKKPDDKFVKKAWQYTAVDNRNLGRLEKQDGHSNLWGRNTIQSIPEADDDDSISFDTSCDIVQAVYIIV